MKSSPTVSIIIPTYNRARLLKRALRSVLDQTYKDFEVIVVDDGSVDDTEGVVGKFHDDRIRYLRHKQSLGAGAANNTGIREARGEYVAFQDSDDEWLPQKLEKQMRVFETSPPEVGVVYCANRRCDEAGRCYKASWIVQKEGYLFKELLRKNFLGPPSAVVRKECFKIVGGFDETLSCLMDWELWIRISRFYKFRFIEEFLWIAHSTPGGMHEQSHMAHAGAFQNIMEKHLEDIMQDKTLFARYCLYIGHFLYMGGQRKEGKEYFMRAIRLNSKDVRIVAATVASHLGFYNMAVGIYQKFRRL